MIDDQSQRRSIASALNQWIASSAEKATGIGSHFATSLELTPATEFVPELKNVARMPAPSSQKSPTAPQLDSGAASNENCPSPFPSGF